jgi:hypothetical protein
LYLFDCKVQDDSVASLPWWMVIGEEELHFWLGWLLYFPTILLRLYVLCMSLNEVKRRFMTPGRSLDDFLV